MRRSPRRSRLFVVPALAALTAAAATGLAGPASAVVGATRPAGARAASPRDVGPPAAPVDVSIDARGPAGPVVPADLLGFSLEKRTLATTQTDGRFGTLPTLMRGLGSGTVRFGGDTVDSTSFVGGGPDSATRPPKTSTVVTPADYDRLATLTQASGWRVILGVNLARYDPPRAADEVAAAAARLGPALLAVEVGNEPNAYGQRGLRDPAYGPSDYQGEFGAYRDAITGRTPGIPVVGSASYPPFTNAFDPGFALPGTFVTQHLYPLNNCRGLAPTIPLLLGRNTAAGEAAQIRQGLAVAQAHAIGLRLSETNSVICSGTPGVSNTQGAALWTIDHVLQAASLGVTGVNMHGGLQQCGMDNPASTSPWYTPLCAPGPDALGGNAFAAQPVYYGLQVVKQFLGTSFVRATYNTRQNVVVRATRDDVGTVRAVIDNMDPPGSTDSLVRLVLPPGYDEALVSRLVAPAVDATSGLTFGGQAVAPDGTLAPPATERVTGRGGITYVRVTPGTAAVVTLVPRCTVPSVKGLTLDQAKFKLVAGGCRPGIVSRPRSIAKGAMLIVQKQRLPAGFRYRIEQPVHLLLMAKPQPKQPKKPAKPTSTTPAPAPARAK